ncbi:MAG TPA: hypothetical protein DHU88_12230 [Pseudomonas sp.]|nr:hypothetical protein [Pseudomonas sp.]
MFSCSKIEQKQLSTWVSFQSAEQSLLGQFSVSGNKQLAHTLSEMKNAGRVEALRAGIDKLQHLQADLLGLLPPDQKPD